MTAAAPFPQHGLNHSAGLMVLDAIMAPGMDGLETCRQVVESKPGHKAFIASGFSETERVKALQRLGVDACLKKPYTLENIGQAVGNALSGWPPSIGGNPPCATVLSS